LGQHGPDPVEQAVDARLGVRRAQGALWLEPALAADPTPGAMK